ncbi:MAG: two-component system, OmpR family, alkaline phosphatase synthesis response regulator PhoP [Bacteroidales bacterium]|nr:two-component system, OmpR family, alkaline phosphatase synthesis response regulator PhoP [Bacteroidales bacterium]MDN5330206.1 two-component system, OmpR family, alkaline phosphatase synthesis response regulator PhoP [Bacteroidales bacterium]
MEAYVPKILIVDDEPDITDFLSYNLRKEGYSVRSALDGETGMQIANEFLPDLIILDLMLPGEDGISITQNIREHPLLKDTLIMLLTARGEDYSQVAGFTAGADDYVVKPVRPAVIVSRVKALLKRKIREAKPNHDSIAVAGLIIDTERFIVQKGQEEITLSKKEFELLQFLATKPGRVFSREEIFDAVWGVDAPAGDRTIDVHVRKLREKLGSDLIKTFKGVGYCLG